MYNYLPQDIMYYTVKKNIFGKRKSLKQPASADFWVFSTCCFKLIQQKLRHFLNNKLRKLKNLLKLVALNF